MEKDKELTIESNLEFVMSFTEEDWSEKREEAHEAFKEYFRESVTKQFIDQGKMPDLREHEEIGGELKVLVGALGPFGDQDPYIQGAMNSYEDFAAIRSLEASVQELIESGRMPEDKEQADILNRFPGVRKGLGKHLEKNPDLKQDYERISKAYLDLLETKRKVEESIENTDIPLIETNQEDSCIDYPSKLRQLDTLIQSGQELDHKTTMEEFKTIYIGLTTEKNSSQDQYLKELFNRYKSLYQAKHEKKVSQKKGELDGMVSQSPNKVMLEPGWWTVYQSKKFEKFIPPGETKMHIKKILPDMELVFVEYKCGVKLHIDIPDAEQIVKEKTDDK